MQSIPGSEYGLGEGNHLWCNLIPPSSFPAAGLEAGVFHSSCYDLFIQNISLSLLSVKGFVLGSVFLLFNPPDRVSFWVYRGIETASITHRANPTSTDGWHRPDISSRCQNDTYFWRISPKNMQTSSRGHGSPQNKLYSVEGGIRETFPHGSWFWR